MLLPLLLNNLLSVTPITPQNDGGFIGSLSEDARGGSGGRGGALSKEDEEILMVINAFLSCH